MKSNFPAILPFFIRYLDRLLLFCLPSVGGFIGLLLSIVFCAQCCSIRRNIHTKAVFLKVEAIEDIRIFISTEMNMALVCVWRMTHIIL